MASQVLNNPKPQIFVKPDGTSYKFSAQKGFGDVIHKAIKEHGGVIENNPRVADFTLVHPSVQAKRGDVYYNWNLITDCCTANPPTFFTGDELERYRMPETNAKTTGRSSFSKRDDDLIREVLLANQNVGGNVIWKKFAADHPESVHTWQSWRDRALKKIRPTLPKRLGGGEELASTSTASSSTAEASVPATRPTEDIPTASGNVNRPASPEITTSPMRTPPLRPTRTAIEHSPHPLPAEIITSPMRTPPLRPTRTVTDHSPRSLPSPTSRRGRSKERRGRNVVEDTESISNDVGTMTRANTGDVCTSKKPEEPGKPAKRAHGRNLEVTVEVISLKRRR